jgi:hypothetical protein
MATNLATHQKVDLEDGLEITMLSTAVENRRFNRSPLIANELPGLHLKDAHPFSLDVEQACERWVELLTGYQHREWCETVSHYNT